VAYKISICNNKGGVGKTNVTINVAACIAAIHGMSVRIVDLDPQADSSAALGFEVAEEEDAPSILDSINAAWVRQRLITGTASSAVQECRWDVPWADKISFIPARFDLEEANHVAPTRDSFLRLRAAMEDTTDDVDIVIYDCPPSLGVLPQMAWADSDDLLLVTQPSFRSFRGLRRTRSQLHYVREGLLVPDLDFCGVIINGTREQTKNHQHWTSRIVAEFGEDSHWGTIPLRARLSRLDDELRPVVMMEDGTEKNTLLDHYMPIADRIRELAKTTDTEEI
jgi:chromosome partitioning protein